MSISRRRLFHSFGAVLALLALPALAGAQIGGGPWKPAPAPLMTRWAKDVSPTNARPEYPRPLLVRKDWKSLNGLWEFTFDDDNTGRAAGWASGKPLPDKILVPFTFEAALSGIGRGKEVHERVWYRRTFDVPKGWSGRRVRLNFGAVDWEATVWVNGREMGAHRGGYTPFAFDITDALKPGGGPQEVVVAVYDPADPKQSGFQPKGKQLGSEGIWYTRTTGIWQTVWIEPVNASHIAGVTLTPERASSGNTWRLRADVTLPSDPLQPGRAARVEMVVSLRGQVVGRADFGLRARAPQDGPLTLPLETPLAIAQIWTPEHPTLYDVKLTLRRGGDVLDEVTSYAALRTVGIANGRLTLNGRPCFYRGVLDQGFWPDGIYTPPTDAAIKNDVEMTKKLGFNMARKHVKVDDPRWYYWCDRLGLLVWQDMPSSHNLQSEEAKRNFTREWREVIAATQGHPSVVHWIPFNENWGNPQAFQDEIVTLTRETDPTRPITDASGWTQRALTDVVDAHDYSNNLKKQGVANPTKPKVVGEFGGIALPIENHTWTTGWGYQQARDPAGLVRRIRFQTTQLFEAANLSGFVYTQLTDVEQELNGLLTYDRLPKAPPVRVAVVFEGADRAEPGGYVTDWLVLGPLPAGTRIASATNSRESRAALESVLDKPFLRSEANLTPTEGQSAAAPSGTALTWQRVHSDGDSLDLQKVFGGENNNAVAYAVAYVESPSDLSGVTLRFGSDDAARVWLNGAPIWTTTRVRGVSPDDDEVPNLKLKAGRNVLVVKVAQGVGGWGLAARFEKPDGALLRAAGREPNASRGTQAASEPASGGASRIRSR